MYAPVLCNKLMCDRVYCTAKDNVFSLWTRTTPGYCKTKLNWKKWASAAIEYIKIEKINSFAVRISALTSFSAPKCILFDMKWQRGRKIRTGSRREKSTMVNFIQLRAGEASWGQLMANSITWFPPLLHLYALQPLEGVCHLNVYIRRLGALAKMTDLVVFIDVFPPNLNHTIVTTHRYCREQDAKRKETISIEHILGFCRIVALMFLPGDLPPSSMNREETEDVKQLWEPPGTPTLLMLLLCDLPSKSSHPICQVATWVESFCALRICAAVTPRAPLPSLQMFSALL